MNLHKDAEAFRELVEATSNEFNLQSFQVEKDYYVSFFLKNLYEVAPYIVFKGGTSLSKCYDVIDRFSEDIDLTIYFEENKLSTNQLKSNQRPLIQAINDTIEKLAFTYLNDEETPVHSGRKFNQYKVGFDRAYKGEGEIHMLDHILIETTLTYKPFPCEVQKVSNYITKFMEQEEYPELIEKYEMHPFEMKIQSINRTFIDKIFAICDYHHEKDYDRKSRHIYDIHKIYQSDYLNIEDLPSLVEQIIEIRRIGYKTHSCQTGYRPLDVLQEIIDTAIFKDDYTINTREFLSKYVDYETAIESLKEILTKGWIPKEISKEKTSILVDTK